MNESQDIRPECNRRFKELEKRNDDMSTIKEAIVQIKEYIANAKEDAKEQDIRESKREVREEKLTEAINNINSNLTELNRDSQELKVRIGDVETELKEHGDKFIINWADLLKKALITFLLSGFGALLMYGFTTLIK